MFDIRNIQNLTQICLRYLLYITEFSVVWYHLSCHASPTFGRYSQWCVCDCTYPSSFPAWQEIKIHRRCIFPRGGIEGIRRREGKDRDNGRQRERGKIGRIKDRKERATRSSLRFLIQVRRSCVPLCYFQRCTSSYYNHKITYFLSSFEALFNW